ncbi:NAD(P)H-hydrate dehydratase [Peribacillus sp. SCS-37]|uniref:NAD(P)H-hydrate dehydratase n=1 Tax=Paraperibacillus esterisolvens TaxID=3115296 RepID=UPI00390678DC
MFVYTSEQIRAADASAEKQGLTGFMLMEAAGRELFYKLEKLLDKKDRILILAGPGKNGGDGIVAARYLLQNGYACDLTFPAGEPKDETAARHAEIFRDQGFRPAERSGSYDMIVEALAGIGTRLPLRENVKEILDWVNGEKALKIAVDVPAGVLADRGEADSSAFKADVTFSIHGFKPSLFMEETAEYFGRAELVEIGLPQDSNVRVWTKEDVKRTFPKRASGSHKGTFGNGLIIAGSDDMPGAAILCSLSAKRSGIGKLTVGTSQFVAGIIASRVPECVFLFDGLQKTAQGDISEKMTAAAIGPGLHYGDTLEAAVEQLLKTEIPLIIDAGALVGRTYPERKAPVIVTPHPGEFQKMTGKEIKEFQQVRIETAAEFSRENGVIIVLKGRNTVIAYPDGEVRINMAGNAGLAKGGSGDSLTGIMLAHAASYKDIKDAVSNAVYFHAACADYWKETRAKTTLLASDIDETMPYVMKEFEGD